MNFCYTHIDIGINTGIGGVIGRSRGHIKLEKFEKVIMLLQFSTANTLDQVL